MRVAAVVLEYLPHRRIGAEIATHEMMRALVDAGHEVDVFCTRRDDRLGPFDGVTLHGFRDMAAIARAHVLFTHYQLAYAAFRDAPRTTRRVVMYHSGPKNPRIEPPPGTDLVVANSRHLAARMVGTAPTLVVHPPVRPDQHRVESTGDAVTQVYLTREKGADLFWWLARVDCRRRFLAVQGGYGSDLSGRASNVTVLDHGIDDMRTVWQQTRVLLAPSVSESYGMAAVEAACAGVPAIAHPSPGVREALGEAAVYVDREDLVGWRQALAELDDPDVYRFWSQAALERVSRLDPTVELVAFVEAMEALAPVAA